MSFFDHAAKMSTSCNSCSGTGSSMGTMGDSMGSMDGSMDGYMGTMGGYMVPMGDAVDNANEMSAETEEKVTRAQQHYRTLTKEFEKLKNSDTASLLKARKALEKLLVGVPKKVVKNHLGDALRQFLENSTGFTFESALVSVRSAVLVGVGAGFGVDLFFRSAVDAVKEVTKEI